MQGAVPGEPSFSSSRATEGYYALRREDDADKETVMFVVSSLKSVLKEVGAQGSGQLGSAGAATLVWAGKPQLGNAAWGASFPSERALPAGGFGSVHTPSP